MDLRFYHCDLCGKVITILTGTDTPTNCCGQPMKELIPNRTDGAAEKHVPVYSVLGNSVLVKIGSASHPMTDKHRITWIGLRTTHGFQFRELCPGDMPVARFSLSSGEQAEEVYAYCNLHGLWSADKAAEGGE